MKSGRILCLVGPTASGKTTTSLLVAGLLDGEIVSADSRQIYRYLNIGTAKPTLRERKSVPHHFIDILDPTEDYSAGQFGQESEDVIRRILRKGKLPILVGGSGLYIKSVVDGLFEGPGKDPEIRVKLEEQFREEGLKGIANSLKEIDPLALKNMKEITPRRVIRALEVYYITGKPISEFHKEHAHSPAFECVQFGLEWTRKELYDRINRRVDEMISSGLIDEVRAFTAEGIAKNLNALNTVGYKEVLEFLSGELRKDEMIDLIKRNTRRFAKRQMTWFKADKRIKWISVSGDVDFARVARSIADEFKESSG